MLYVFDTQSLASQFCFLVEESTTYEVLGQLMNYQSSIVVDEAHNSHYVHTRNILATARCSGRTLLTCKLSNNNM